MSDFGGFGAIAKEARELDKAERAAKLVACPRCGTPLEENSRKVLNCPLGHYRTAGHGNR